MTIFVGGGKSSHFSMASRRDGHLAAENKPALELSRRIQLDGSSDEFLGAGGAEWMKLK